MPSISSSSSTITVKLPVLRSVVSGSKVMLQVVGSMTLGVGDAQGLYVGPNGYTSDSDQAQDFAPTISDDQITIESPGAPGKSSYQMWLEDGHSGTYAEYFAALRGDPGLSPTPEQISSLITAYLIANPPKSGADATPEQIASAVAEYLALHPPKNGVDGADATLVQVSSAVSSYMAANPVSNGKNATDAQVAQAVSTYIAAHPPADGKSVELQASGTSLQARQSGGQWSTIFDLSQLLGADGKSVELQKTSTAIQWRQSGGAWADLVLLSAVTGPAGPSSLVTLGTVSVGQTATVAITAGVRSIAVSVPGVLAGDNILLFPTAAMPAGYAIHNAVATAKDTLQVTLTAPVLAIGASFSIACRVVALR